jgi:RNA processing factor Prp31
MTLTEARRLCRHAAELLERRARTQRSIFGDASRLPPHLRELYADLLATARGLRKLAKGKK